jgi:hypothetical protein
MRAILNSNLESRMEARLTSLQSMPTPSLVERLAEKLSVTAEALEELACIVRILEDRGEDLSALRIGILPLLRKIAYGQLLPGLVAQFAGKPLLLRHAQNLPIPDQRRLLSGEKIKVVIVGDAGQPDAMFVEPHRLTAHQVRQVIGPDGVRDDGEQRSYIEDHRKPARVAQDVVVDTRRGGVTINGKWFTRSELATLLARLG